MIRVEVKRRIMYIKSCNTLLNSDRVIGLFWLRDVEIESSISQQCNRKILLHPPECKSTLRFSLLHSFCFSINPIRQNASQMVIAVYLHLILDVRKMRFNASTTLQKTQN